LVCPSVLVWKWIQKPKPRSAQSIDESNEIESTNYRYKGKERKVEEKRNNGLEVSLHLGLDAAREDGATEKSLTLRPLYVPIPTKY